VITLGKECFRCPEALFQPFLFHVEQCWSFVLSQYSIKTNSVGERSVARRLPWFLLQNIYSYICPSRSKLKKLSLHHIVMESISKCENDIPRELYCNIVLAGGNTMFDGFAERLRTEIETHVPGKLLKGLEVVAPPERKYSTWIGGSILASLSTFGGMWISANEYNETGPQIVHRKCF